MFNHIIITGASSGIGAALALHYARAHVTLSLTGRNEARLEQVSAQCRAKGAEVNTKIIDVTDCANMKDWLCRIDSQLPVDLVIANAGISAGTGGGGAENPEQVRKLFEVNLDGVLNTINPLLPRMIERKQGHVALMSSLAGFRGWPGAPAYCASKAAVKIYGEGLRGTVTETGVKVHVIMPGFVESRMTDANDFSMPFMISAQRAATIIAKGIEKDKGRIAFPLSAHIFAWLLGAMPDALAQKSLKNMPGKAPAGRPGV